MAHFDPNNKREIAMRTWKTHAFGSRLFAAHPVHQSNATAWEFNARAWDDLIVIKKQMAESDRRTALIAARMPSCLSHHN